MSLNFQENEIKSEILSTHSVYPAFDANNKMSIFEEKSCMKPTNYQQQPLLLKNTSSTNCLGIESESETLQTPPTLVNNDGDGISSSNDSELEESLLSPSSSSSSGMNYYEDDEDLERFCEQEMSTSRRINSDIETLKIEDGNLESVVSQSSNSCNNALDYCDGNEGLKRFCEQEMITSKRINSDVETLKIEDGNLESVVSQSSNSCNSALDHCEGNEGLKRYCEQEMITSKRMKSDIEFLTIEDGNLESLVQQPSIGSRVVYFFDYDLDTEGFCEKDINSSIEPLKFDGKLLESPASSNNKTGSTTTETKPIGVERKNTSVVRSEALSNPDLLMQVSKFFAKNPVVGEVVDRNELVSSKYFTDEFAMQHGLTLDEN